MQPCSARLNVHQTTRSQTGRSNGATARARTHEHVHSSFLLCVQLRYNRDCTVRAPINCITALLTDPHNELSAHSVWICVVWCARLEMERAIQPRACCSNRYTAFAAVSCGQLQSAAVSCRLATPKRPLARACHPLLPPYRPTRQSRSALGVPSRPPPPPPPPPPPQIPPGST
jgi:hypothetical protein